MRREDDPVSRKKENEPMVQDAGCLVEPNLATVRFRRAGSRMLDPAHYKLRHKPEFN